MPFDREKVIGDCIKSLYIRFRKKIPEETTLLYEIKFAVKDLFQIPNEELKDAFALAYRLHDKDRLPYSKEILSYWKAGRVTTTNAKACGSCADGLLSKYRRIVNPTDKTKTYDKTFTFRCDCAAGQRMSQYFLTWDNQRGYRDIGDNNETFNKSDYNIGAVLKRTGM